MGNMALNNPEKRNIDRCICFVNDSISYSDDNSEQNLSYWTLGKLWGKLCEREKLFCLPLRNQFSWEIKDWIIWNGNTYK